MKSLFQTEKNTSTTVTKIEEFDDGRTHDPQAVRAITQQWVDKHMKNREMEFTDFTKATIFCGTWNVNAKKQEGSLNDWILPEKQVPCDVYAIGFQEIVDLNAMNVALDASKTIQRTQFWQEQITECLGLTGIRYVMVSSKPLVGLLLCIYAKETIADKIKDVRDAQQRVGIMGLMGNKGGVSIRMSLFDSSICFVCSHLAAHLENVAGRNSDFKNIMEKTSFTALESPASNDNEVTDLVVKPRHGAAQTVDVDLTIGDHELVFWLGDLNYRIEAECTIEAVFEKIQQNQLEFLRQKDQLNIERKNGNVFHGFEEGLLDFAPTYKYQPGTDDYDRRPDKKIRVPAWCDRVLWRTSNTPASSVKQLSYRRSNLMPSDHKPVSASFDCDVRVVNSDREKNVYQEIIMQLEYWRNNEMPTVEIDGLKIAIANCRYEVESTSTMKIRNVGKTIAHWHFCNKLEDSRFSKRWVELSQTGGLLLPSEETEVVVTVKIDTATAQVINSGKETLDDVLVLRIENSKDFFVEIHATYDRSCYGMSLEELVSTAVPVRNTCLPAVDGAASSSAEAGPDELPQLAIPKELWRLIDALWTGGALKQRDLFAMTVVDPAEIISIRESLDCGVDFTPVTAHALAEALTTFLSALARPLLSTESCPTTDIDSNSMPKFCRRLLESLQPLNYNSFVYVISFMREVLSQADYNRSTSARLAAVCVSCMTSLVTAAADHASGSGSGSSSALKEERAKRELKQQVMQSALEYLITSASL